MARGAWKACPKGVSTLSSYLDHVGLGKIGRRDLGPGLIRSQVVTHTLQGGFPGGYFPHFSLKCCYKIKCTYCTQASVLGILAGGGAQVVNPYLLL